MVDPDPDILCHCFHVPEEEVRDAVASEGLRSVSEVTACTRAGGGCFSCWPEIEAILKGGSESPLMSEMDPASREIFQKEVQELLDKEFSRLFALNQVRVTLLDVEERGVLLQCNGPWKGKTPLSFEVIRDFLEQRVSALAGRRIKIWEGHVGLDEESGLPTL
ncbi:MAG: (2Fe-2S)-binding protein [Planctomycetota bacterium]|jgi:bacterioferritin-associated ferredoxin|nr:(2Fe-2S)-binding protein [Planctomycetota bacterium]